MLRKILAAIASINVLLSFDVQAQDFCCDNSYYDDCCNTCCDDCSGGFWIDAEYLYWKIKDSPKVIPLVVEGPVVPGGSPVLDQPDTEVILGGKKIHNQWRSGGRLSLGYWFDCQKCFGAEANFFILPKDSKKQRVFSDGLLGSSFLTVPFFDVTTGEESSVTIARPGSFSGKATLKLSNRMLGAELNGLTTISSSCNLNISLLGGFRYWNFVERLSFDTDSPFVPPNPADVYQTQDKFHVKNNFYGGQIGARLDYLCNDFFFNIKGKVALGAMCQSVDIHGHLLTNDFNGFNDPETFPGGYFALPTNIGHHKQTRFSVIPEANINVGYQITDCFRLQVGYTFLYASNVLWASKQVSRRINPTQSPAIEFDPDPVLVGEAKPKASLKTEGLWVQGVSAGFEFGF